MSTYLALTEIASDRESNEVGLHLNEIEKYASMEKHAISRNLKLLAQAGVIVMSPQNRTFRGVFGLVTIILTDVEPTAEHIDTGSVRASVHDTYMKLKEDNIYKTGKTDKNREKKREPAPSFQSNSAPLTPAMQTVYDILTAGSAQPLSVDTFLLSYPLWLKAAGGRNLEDLARACIAWHMERGEKVAYPVSAFTTWLDNAKPKKQSGEPRKMCPYWPDATDYNDLESDQKEYMINAIKMGPPMYGKNWTPPANTPQKYVDMFNSRMGGDNV